MRWISCRDQLSTFCILFTTYSIEGELGAIDGLFQDYENGEKSDFDPLEDCVLLNK